MRTLQVSITIVSILVTGFLLVRQLRRAKKRIRLRPRLDLLRIAVQLGAVIVMAMLLDAGAPIAALVLVGLFAVGPGFVQGRNLTISDDDGKLYAVRNTVAAAVWGVGLVIMQFAGLLKRTGILGLGQATAWVGVGLAIGLFVGRRGPVTEYRRAATAVAVPAAAVAIGVLALAVVGGGRDSHAQEADRWVRVSEVVNPAGAESPAGWDVSPSASSLAVVQFFVDDPRGAEGTFEASWEPPPTELVSGDQLAIPVTVSGRNTGNLETQYFFGLHVILIVNGTWNDEAVSAGASCAQTTVISGIYECTEPETNSGEMRTTVGSYDEQFRVGVGALNCASCYVEWTYERAEAPVTTAAGVDAATDGEEGTGVLVGDDGDTTDGVEPADDVDALEDFIEEQQEETGIEPDEAMAAAIAGVIAALATGGISLVEAMDQVARIFEEGSELERRPRLPDPVDPDAEPLDGTATELVTDEPDLESVRRTGSELDDELADYIRRLPPPGKGLEIDDVLDVMERLAQAAKEQDEHWRRPFDMEEFTRVWDALGGVADDPSAATADELRHAFADLLDRQVGAVPTWLVSWAMRNPAAAAEMTVRMGAAYMTGGASELVLIPWDVNRDITAARDAAIARGEDFTFEDGLIAGARGQVIGLVVDGAGAAANASRRAAGETLAEIAARTEARAAGGTLDEAAESLGRARPDADDLAAASRRNTDPDAWRGMDNEPPGSKIPPEHIRQTGYTPEQAKELQRVAAEHDVIIGTRETNLDSTRWIESGDAIPKPIEIKAKTINELDELIGGPPADQKGLVGFFEPTEPPMPREANPALWDRYDTRLDQWNELSDEMAMMEGAGYSVRDGVVHKVYPDERAVPFAGDIDGVAILDGRTGTPLTGPRLERVVGDLKNSGANLQHGVESSVVNDIVAHETAGLRRGSREYSEAFDKAMDKATALADKLNQGHLSGNEQVFWTHARGHYRGPQLNRLGDWQQMAAGSLPTRPIDEGALSALRPVIRAINDDQ